MPTTIPSDRVDFLCGATRCAAWLTLPPGAGPHPAVVLVHGLGATHEMMLPQYEQHFAAAGIATLAFEYRNTGASDGEPRQHISMRRQRADVAAAMDFLAMRSEIDAGRVGLWGTPWRDDCAVGCRVAERCGGGGGPVPDGARAGRGAPPGCGVGAAAESVHRRGCAAGAAEPRAALCADRRAAGQYRCGDRRRRRGGRELHASTRRARREPGRGGRRHRGW